MKLLEISPWCCILAAAGVLMLPFRLLTAALFAAMLHELCHLGVLSLFSVPVLGIRVSPFGAVIRSGYMTSGQELLCSAAGPAGSFILLLTWKVFPLLAICGLIQGIFNLLPLYPMDGGRIIRALTLLGKEKYLAKRGRNKYNSVE